MEIKGLKIDTSRLRNLLGNFKGVSKLSEIRPETRTYDVQTSLTTDYRKNNWGLGRIVLDGISNHLPEDSGGTRTTVKIKQGGVYRDLKSADPSVAAEEVVFEDDGKGFDSGLLGLLYSTKAADTMSVGQFGEGLKMISAAALRAGQEIEFKSKNWSAVPFAQDETVGGNALKRLCFRVSENGHHLQGSRTVFKKPSKTLLEEVFKIPENVLESQQEKVAKWEHIIKSMTPEEKESYIRELKKTADWIYEHGTVIEDDRDRYDRYARSH